MASCFLTAPSSPPSFLRRRAGFLISSSRSTVRGFLVANMFRAVHTPMANAPNTAIGTKCSGLNGLAATRYMVEASVSTVLLGVVAAEPDGAVFLGPVAFGEASLHLDIHDLAN